MENTLDKKTQSTGEKDNTIPFNVFVVLTIKGKGIQSFRTDTLKNAMSYIEHILSGYSSWDKTEYSLSISNCTGIFNGSLDHFKNML